MKPLHYALSFTILFLSLFLGMAFGRLFYASIAGGHGLYSAMYLHYNNVTKTIFDAYLLFILLSSAVVAGITCYATIKKKTRKLYTASLVFIIIATIIALFETYLATNYIGKG